MGRQKIHLRHLQRLHEKDGMPPKQYEGPASYALTKEEEEIFFECLLSMKVLTGFSSNIKGIINIPEKNIPEPKVSCLPHDYDANASGCIEGASTGKRPISHCEAMCIPQCNLSEGDRSRNHTKAKE